MVSFDSTHKFDIFAKIESSSDTTIVINILSVLWQTLNYFYCIILRINSQLIKAQLRGEFDRGHLERSNTRNISYTNASNFIYENNTFFGISSFHIENDHFLTLTSAQAADSVSISSNRQMDYISMNYIIFSV